MNRKILLILIIIVLPSCSPSHLLNPATSSLTPASLDEMMLASEEYLAHNLMSSSFGGKVFCALEYLALEDERNSAKIYVWALCSEYYDKGGALYQGTAVSEPVLVYLIAYRDGYLGTGHAEPISGEDWIEDVQTKFPPNAIEKMCLNQIECYNERASRLEEISKQKAELFFQVPLATSAD